MSQTGRQQHLYAIRNESLNRARECVKDAGSLAWVNPVLLTDFPGNVTDSKDGHRIIGRT